MQTQIDKIKQQIRYNLKHDVWNFAVSPEVLTVTDSGGCPSFSITLDEAIKVVEQMNSFADIEQFYNEWEFDIVCSFGEFLDGLLEEQD